MKKAISILLVLVMALSLCACGNANSKYVGIWRSADTTLHLYEDGVALRHVISDSPIDGVNPYYGTWDVREGYIIFYYMANGASLYTTYEIISDNQIGNYMRQ